MKLRILASFLVIGIFSIFVFADVKIEDLDFLAPRVADTASVPPTEAGLIVYDTSEAKFKGRHPDGTFTYLGNPAGTVLPFVGTTAPDGFLLCDGSQVSRTTYAALFSVIGTNFGSGDGLTTFHLPDLRGKFLRGADSGAGNDLDASSRIACEVGGSTGDNVGSCQADELKSHKHTTRVRKYSSPGGSAIPIGGSGTPSPTAGEGTGFAGGSETRPKNVAINYIIKI